MKKKSVHCYAMCISLKNNPNKANDLVLYRFKSQYISLNIKSHGRGLIGKLELQGAISRMKQNEQSKFCAPAGFVPKKSRQLQFVIDFTALNKYVNRPLTAFPSSHDIARSLKANTTHMACIDFPSGYFQALLSKDP